MAHTDQPHFMDVFKSPFFKVVLPSLAIFLLLRVVFWLSTFPNPDEAYYWLWGQHPDFSYYDHPPFQAWVEGLFTVVFGKSFFTLRLPNLISNAVFFYVYYRISTYLYGKDGINSFWLSVVLILASPLYFLFLALAWHDHWLITFSLIAAYQFVRFLDSYTVDGLGETKRLYGAGVAIAFAFLCKYNAIFVAAGLVATVIFHQQWRPLLRDRRLYLAGAIALCGFIPIVLWNVNNDFQSFQYYVNRSVDDQGFRLKIGETLGFIGLSILTISPVNAWAMVQVIKRPRSNFSMQHPSSYHTVAIWIFAISTLALMAVSLVSTALYYWNINAYILLFQLLPSVFIKKRQPEMDPACAFQDSQISTHQLRKPLFYSGQFYGLLFAALLVIHYSVIPLSAFGSPDGDPDSRMLYGWDQVGAAVEAQRAAMGDRAFLVTTDYRSASALAYQLNDPDVLAISDRIDQFDFWYDPNALKGKNAILLSDDWHPIQPKLLAQFEQTSSPITVPVRRFGIWIKNYYIIQGKGFKGE